MSPPRRIDPEDAMFERAAKRQHGRGDGPLTFKLLTTAHTVRVIFARHEGDKVVVAGFGCVACESPHVWEADHWTCLDCGQDLYPDEASFIVERSLAALNELSALVQKHFPNALAKHQPRRGLLWALAQWFRKR